MYSFEAGAVTKGDHLMRIAFFDSGIGGITVLKKAIELIPECDYIYYADTKNVPYGIKPKEEVRKYIIDAVEFLSGKDIQALVVACNTATSVAITDLRRKFDFPIIGMEPAVKPAILKNAGKKILVLATSLTLKESKLQTLIKTLDKKQRVEKLEMDMLVQYAEQFDFCSEGAEQYMKEKLARISLENFETIVLGCTHFLYYKKQIERIAGKEIAVIDGNEGTVKNLVNTVKTMKFTKNDNERKITFYSSGEKDSAERVVRLMELISMKL
jgi:glutamate racemase